MIRTQVQLTDEQARTLRLLAADLNTSIAELIRQAVERLLSERAHLAAKDRMAESVGGFRSGRSDISKSHDRYLGDAYEE